MGFLTRLGLLCGLVVGGVSSVGWGQLLPLPSPVPVIPEFGVVSDDRGISSLANAKDPFGANPLPRGSHVGLYLRYRLRGANGNGTGNWVVLPTEGGDWVKGAEEGKEGRFVTYRSSATAPFVVTQSFKTVGTVLDWEIVVEATAGGAGVEIGDLGIVLPWARPGGQDEKAVFEQGFTKHQFIEGYGSYIYFTRASGIGPFLLVSTRPDTKLEYTGTAGGGGGRGARGAGAGGGGGGGGGWMAMIHSAATAGAQTEGNWRQANTSLKLGAPGTATVLASYGFRFEWANSYEGLREALYKQGLMDIRVVPGMTVPEDLTARFSIRTTAKIEGIEAEFPGQTKITSLGAGGVAGSQVYEVKFGKLGENKLTVKHDGGRETYLEFFASESLETLIKKRANFIALHQQWRDPNKWFNGLFSVYDMKNKILRSPEDIDGWTGRLGYILACDDTALGKAPYVAAKNVAFPVREEIEAVEYYLEKFVWGGLQRTDKETPYPYGVYGIPNWKIQRDPVAKADFEINANNRPDLAEKMRVWRSYDYPHMTMLYFHMYEIARKYPGMVKYLDWNGYLERAYQTAHAYFTYPYELLPLYYETYKWGCYNELVILSLADALDAEGMKDRAAWLRAEWEKKVKYFVYDDAYPFRSEYAFDRTAYESSYALAKYGATHDMKPDVNLWHDIKLNKDYSHPVVKREDSRAFMDRQQAANLAVRGVLEPAYYLLGADYTGSSDRGAMSYMAQMGGWAILDYGVNFAADPADCLQLGYASYLGAWSLMNTGKAEGNYGFWFPGKENDGATGWTFMTAKFGRGWYGKDDVRGPWHYDGEIDLGYGGALRTAATIVTRDPTFGWIAYGGVMKEEGGVLSVEPRDGLRQRFYAVVDSVLPNAPSSGAKPGPMRLKMQLDRDGFAAGQNVVIDAGLGRVAFSVENRTGDEHVMGLWMSVPASGGGVREVAYSVMVDGQGVAVSPTGIADYPLKAMVKVGKGGAKVEVVRQAR